MVLILMLFVFASCGYIDESAQRDAGNSVEIEDVDYEHKESDTTFDLNETINETIDVPTEETIEVPTEEPVEEIPSYISDYYGLPVGNMLSEDERRYFSEALANAINNGHYFFGEYSYNTWILNGIGAAEVEVYENRLWGNPGYRRFCFIILKPVLDENEGSYYYQREVYLSVWLSMDRAGFFAQTSVVSYRQDSVEGLRDELVGQSQWHSNNYCYIGNIWIDIPPVYPPNVPNLFSRTDDLIVAIIEAGVPRFTLYMGLQDRSVLARYDESGKDLIKEVVYFCVVIDGEKYYGRCTNHSDYYPVLSVFWPGTDLPFRETYDEEEVFLLEQIIKLGNKYEIYDSEIALT